MTDGVIKPPPAEVATIASVPTPAKPKIDTKAARQKIAAALWRRGELDWKLEEHQVSVYARIKQVMQKPRSIFVLHASRRFGKSFLLMTIAFEFALTHPNAVILYAAATQKQVGDIIESAVEPLMVDCPDDVKPTMNATTKGIKFKNGAQIKIVGLDGKQSDRGKTSHLTIVDEAGFVKNLTKAARGILIPMGITTNATTILSSNSPESPTHPFVTEFIPAAEREGHYVKRTILDIPKFTQTDIDQIAANAGGKDGTYWKREYLCQNLQESENAVLPEWDAQQSLIIKECVKPDFFYPLVAGDLGMVDFTGVLFGYWDWIAGTAVIEDELLLKGVNSERLVRTCQAKEVELWGIDGPIKTPIRVIDGPAFTLNDMCSVHKYSVQAPAKGSLEAQVNAIRLDLQNIRLAIHPRCVNLIRQCGSATWNKGRTEFSRTEAEGHFDMVAALQYFIRAVNRHGCPFPPHYQVDTSNMVMRHKDRFKNNRTFESLRQVFAPHTLSDKHKADESKRIASSVFHPDSAKINPYRKNRRT